MFSTFSSGDVRVGGLIQRSGFMRTFGEIRPIQQDTEVTHTVIRRRSSAGVIAMTTGR